ncbi:MAG TPA: hypothetical protein VH061_03135 [Solirubrobacteraceae bacterium]|nr:hypothetical protein [Solirubrobacteraceae bacterium]
MEGDPLVGNGLGSPTCRSALGPELLASARRNCATSGFIAAAAPTNGYGIDIHIDTGVVPLNGAGLLSTVQNIFVTPLWMALVWLTHALVVMLEWCFSIDLLEGAPAASLQRALAQGQAMITAPWLAFALSVAAVTVTYHGLIRRRVADTLGEALLAVGMFACGFWLMLDPSGTVGALSRWSNQAGLGTLAVVVSGTPVAPARSLGTSMAGVYATGIEAPWCYLEFGNVDWCRNTSRLEPGLKAAGLRIASRRLAEAECSGSACSDGPATVTGALRASARLLREARTNGALFLALPANGPDRNSINQQGSLLQTLCQSSEATHCRGPGAAEAQFRTDGGTWPRVGGLLLIALGLLGMMLLLGYIAARLLLAAVLSVLYLLLVPAVVLAPAFGEAGRAIFRSWAVRLFGAVVSKLIFAFVLGTVLAATSILEALTSLGWWAQWLLMASFWWGAFLKRNDILAFEGARSTERRTQATRMMRGALAARNRFADRREARRKHDLGREPLAVPAASRADSAPARLQLPASSQPHERRGPSQDEQVARVLQAESRGRPTEAERTSQVERGTARLARIRLERDRARLRGDSRRARRLEVRGARIEQELADDRVSTSDGPARRGRRSKGSAPAVAMARMLDEQARLPGAGERADGRQQRDYPMLAGLAGYTRGEYERLDRRSQRKARLQIDRELAARRAATEPGSSGAGSSRGAETESSGERARPPQRLRAPRPGAGAGAEPSVMRDAREVAEGRKRQLGFGRK